MVGGGTNMYPYYLTRYNSFIDLDSPIYIDLSFYMNTQGQFMIQANAEVTGEIATTNNKILLILTRYISDSYSSSVTSYNELNFDLSHIGQTGTYEAVVDVDQGWNTDDLKAVAIVQTFDNDPSTTQHTVNQAAIAGFSYLNPVAPAYIDFGEVTVGSPETRQITITNYWDTELSGMIFPIPNFEVVENYSVPPMDQITVDVVFTPTDDIQYYGDIILTTSNENFQTVFITVTGQGYEENEADDQSISSEKFALIGNHPNPFYNSTSISFALNAQNANDATLEIYNMKGQKIRTFSNLQSTGTSNNRITWDGNDEIGKPVSPGIYYYKLDTNSHSSTKKMLLLR